MNAMPVAFLEFLINNQSLERFFYHEFFIEYSRLAAFDEIQIINVRTDHQGSENKIQKKFFGLFMESVESFIDDGHHDSRFFNIFQKQYRKLSAVFDLRSDNVDIF